METRNPSRREVREAKRVWLNCEYGVGFAEQNVARRPGPHFCFARHHVVAAALAGELERSAEILDNGGLDGKSVLDNDAWGRYRSA